MSAAVSEPRDPAESEANALVESEHAETNMTYGEGRFPWLIALVWVCALAGLATYCASFLFPDLATWGKP